MCLDGVAIIVGPCGAAPLGLRLLIGPALLGLRLRMGLEWGAVCELGYGATIFLWV